jgi:acyl-CoA synthetase (AMP-forming)/AMP-acid ligase II
MSDLMQEIRSARAAAERRLHYRKRGWWPGGSLIERFEKHVAAEPDARAVRDDTGAVLSRRGLWTEAGRLAATLRRRGLRPGDVVLVCLPNTVDWQTAFVACLRLGAVPATIPLTTDADTLAHVTRLVAARAVVAPRSHGSRPIGEEILAAARACGHAVEVLLLGEDRAQSWESVGGDPPVLHDVPSGLCQLMFTSSTTGRPKAVAHTEDTFAAVNLGFAARFGITGAQPIFMASPLGHSIGAWHGARLSLFTGAPLVLQDRWDPDRALRCIAEENCGFTAAATPFLKDLLDASWSGPKLAPMRTFLCGGSPVPPALLDQAREWAPGTFVSVLWGMTEGGVTTCLPDDPPERVAATAGTGLPGLELRTLDADGTPTPPGTAGELVMRGPGVFVGYLGQDDLYRESVTAEGFLRTGDLAELDESGYLRITGRLKELIIRGGVPKRQWPERLCVVAEMPVTAAGKIRKAALRERVTRELG